MKKKIIALLAVAQILLLCPLSVFGQSTDEPIITIKTRAYEQNGELNELSIVLGANAEGQYVDVDCGFGKVEYELAQTSFNPDDQELTGTFITCKVSPAGVIKIYGDASTIDYINADGCYIQQIDFSQCTNLGLLSLNHNELQSLDLTNFPNLSAIYLSDNTFTAETPLKIGGNKPNLTILDISITDYLDQSFNLSDYPKLASFSGYHCLSLHNVDPSGCPDLLRLTLDVTPVKTLDVSHNPNLLILNISDTAIPEIDLSNNIYLTELYCSHESGSLNKDVKLKSLDLTHNPELVYLFCSNNELTQLDISNCPKLVNIYASNNYLTSFDPSNNPELNIVKINGNCLDFTTIPENPGTWSEYEYDQRSFVVDKSYKVGDSIDMSARVNRENSTTEGALFSISEYNPNSPSLLDDSYYTYDNGKITFNKAVSDSVYVAYANNVLTGTYLYTQKFKVKTAEEFGKPNTACSFTTTASTGSEISFSVGVAGATADAPKEFYVDLGNGETQSFYATTSELPEAANIVANLAGYGPIKVSLPEGDMLTALAVNDLPLTSISVSESPSLKVLKLVNTGLYSIDLSWNKSLTTLDLSGNNLFNLTLEGINEPYSKSFLANINVSNNQLTDITLNSTYAIHNLDLSGNSLTELDFSDFDYAESINVANNQFTSLDFTNCGDLRKLNISNNLIESVILPTSNGITEFYCNNNNLTLATIPEPIPGQYEVYKYAPQNDLQIATKGPGVDLSAQNRGQATIYIWTTESGDVLTAGTDYTIENGKTRFINTTVGKIYCAMKNPQFPDFSGDDVFKTTKIEAAEMPTNKIASFTTTADGETVALSLAAQAANTALYIDWAGDGNVDQYLLGTTYRLFSATTYAGVNVGVYTYEPTEKITVFSMKGASLSDFDGKNLTAAQNINVSGAGLSSISLPENSTTLAELILDDNNFSSFDLSKYPALKLFSINNNKLSDLDLSQRSGIQIVSASYNNISNVTFNNPNLWSLYLANNELESISFENAKNIEQLSLDANNLSTLDVSGLSKLIALTLNNNKFTFSTLPPVKSSYAVYRYENQAPIEIQEVDGKVDLSSEATIDGTETVYTWYIDYPTTNLYGELEGEALVEDYEYTLDGGVTTFIFTRSDIVGVLTNEKFPSLTLFTTMLDIQGGAKSVESDDAIKAFAAKGRIVISAEPGMAYQLYNISGSLVDASTTVQGLTTINNLSSGVYLLKVDTKTFKLIVR
ncbi:MAG: T9SS type A sorting domain-containing protein [Candidatus Limisoma sp.]